MVDLRIHVSSLFVLFLLLGCQSPTVIDYDAEALERIVNYNSYWIDTLEERKNYGTVALSPIVDRRITSAIHKNLKDKGFTRKEEQADFQINFHTLTKERTEVHDLSYGPAPFSRSPYFGDYSYGRLYVDNYEEGTLVIDVIDAKSQKLVWRGAHARRLQRKALHADEAQLVVDAILLEFPPISRHLPK
jgi:hypothetical protein